MSASPAVEFVADVSVGAWLAETLDEIDGQVRLSCVLPPAFQAYARILHPVDARRPQGASDEPWPDDVSWSELAARTGRQMHPRVQFDSLIGVDRYSRRHRDWEAEIGTLSRDLWTALSEVLRRHTSDASSCYFALWDGWGWDAGQRVTLGFAKEGQTESVSEPAFAPEVMRGPRLSLPGRDYFVLEGPLDGWPSLFVGCLERDWHSPQLCWPADLSWCLATEIDFDSTYIGGSAELVGAVLSDARFESYPAQPSDRVDYEGDEINGVP
jgi:hypothetical protein